MVPVIRNIHKVIFAAVSQPDALDMNQWHKCKNTHCRAGWVITLAGKKGQELESRFNTELAAIMIYRASGFEISPVRFYDGNEAALADMKRLADAQ